MKMSNQTPQRVRRTGSPSSCSKKQGPLKATVPMSLMGQSNSPTRSSNKSTSPSHSPVSNRTRDGRKFKSRQSPDFRIGLSVDRRSPGSPGYKEKSNTLNIKSISASPYIRRTASLDTIYLAGQWPRDCYYHSYYVRHMMDRATQTDEWEETDRKKGSQRKSPGSGGDQLEMKFIRQRLQRTNKSSFGQGSYNSLQRLSPFQGDHSAISLSTLTGSNNGSVCPSLPSTTTLPSSTSPYHHLHSKTVYSVPMGPVDRSHTGPIPIPHIPKAPLPRILSSVEGLNQVSKGSKSASPDPDCIFKLGTSPHINKFLAREPPDGCEKVKIVDERRNTTNNVEPLGYGPIKPCEKFVLLPSQSSAFYPLYKTCVSPSASDSALHQLTSSHTLTEEKLQ
ncbi:protein FAM117B-like [Limulus polyphemus]|uniref:Protein FAM117B-like n=1 Tax=Limulus polyphemus TaxID=6850 RepID=A0ABM1SKQ6_LIMPO|nr:protein FAM117B-like [Limulus polyphemus]